MGTDTNYAQEYQQAQQAYLQSDFEKAAGIIDRLVKVEADDPSAHLLRGHIYCYGLEQYDVAIGEYEAVLKLTENPEFIEYANNGLEHSRSNQNAVMGADGGADMEDEVEAGSRYNYNELENQGSAETWENVEELEDLNDFDLGLHFNNGTGLGRNVQEPGLYHLEADPFNDQEVVDEARGVEGEGEYHTDPFAFGVAAGLEQWEMTESGAFGSTSGGSLNAGVDDAGETLFLNPNKDDETDFLISEQSLHSETLEDKGIYTSGNADEDTDLYHFGTSHPGFEDETLLMGPGVKSNRFAKGSQEDKLTFPDNGLSDTTGSDVNGGYGYEMESFPTPAKENGTTPSDSFDFDSFDDVFRNSPLATNSGLEGYSESVQGETDSFLDAFSEFDNVGAIPELELQQKQVEFNGAASEEVGMSPNSGPLSAPLMYSDSITEHNSQQVQREDEIFSITSTSGLKNDARDSEKTPSFTPTASAQVEPTVTIEQNLLAPFENAPLKKKNLAVATAAGVVSAIVVAAVSFGAANMASKESKPTVITYLRNTGWVMTLAAGVASFGTTLFLSRAATRPLARTTEDLQAAFLAVTQGNFSVTTTVYSEDEFGRLAAGFNQMTRAILQTTSEAQRKAQEQEQAKEDLQRQVIRLLDDVEGAARGDLTVQAEVTADVLGAVADSFNLTIQNLRRLVQQVKTAARQVNQSSTNSEAFARGLSADALRQAEELAVTLNSVQALTNSIKRVADSAREAEEVARTASATALRGGEAVERTVAGILEIRETVANTTRKVKRLAEASQEISKIVVLISNIASRTNLLALNASIEAARAGEAGRGFAIVADEVRLLADRSAKALKEIQQIVMQIQSETNSVMSAMEEGTQQVIEGTRLAEQAKRSLDDIIQVSNRIDALVRSITADTVEQNEASQSVAHVMHSVEHTAQETSQESQRVSVGLQNLVGVARDLLQSVERFRVEDTETK